MHTVFDVSYINKVSNQCQDPNSYYLLEINKEGIIIIKLETIFEIWNKKLWNQEIIEFFIDLKVGLWMETHT